MNAVPQGEAELEQFLEQLNQAIYAASQSRLAGPGQPPIDRERAVRLNRSYASGPNILLSDAAVFPYLQPAARDALYKAVAQRGQPIMITSAYRTVAQQRLLWLQLDRGICGRTRVATPGTSNHEGGLALDVADPDGWKPYLESYGWKKLVSTTDLVHFDFWGGGTVNGIGKIGVQAFQRLWNKHNPTDPIAEDGSFGPQTGLRLDNSPAEGFPL